ncbi:MAG: ATP-binding protein [Actinobacteria bacterium]|nr:MAG: ATP-binding protein [Actinomycetota bacterium]
MNDKEWRPLAANAARRLALGYAIAAAVWILISDEVLERLGLPAAVERFLNSAKGILFVLVTGMILYVFALRSFLTVYHSEERIRQTYVDVLDAVTGGRLILLTEEELRRQLGYALTEPARVTQASALSEVRHRIADAARSRIPEQVESSILVNAAAEALNNSLKHARGGAYQVFAQNGTVQVLISDGGPGIDFRNLPKATLTPGFSTMATLGVGFTIMLQLSDRVLLSTRPGRTIIVLEVSKTTVPEAPVPAFVGEA